MSEVEGDKKNKKKQEATRVAGDQASADTHAAAARHRRRSARLPSLRALPRSTLFRRITCWGLLPSFLGTVSFSVFFFFFRTQFCFLSLQCRCFFRACIVNLARRGPLLRVATAAGRRAGEVGARPRL